MKNESFFENSTNEIWVEIKKQASDIAKNEPALKTLVDDVVLTRNDLFEAVIARLSRRLSRGAISSVELFKSLSEVLNQKIKHAIVADFLAIKQRDPACKNFLMPLFYYKGFMAITTHRFAHELWIKGRENFAFYLQSLSSEVFAVDIHPAAKFGEGILLDHATGFVAGETSVVENNVSILHEVTLGGTGNETGDRHPKIKSCVLIGAGAKIIGNITIGEGSKIGAGSVVLEDVAPHTTVAGVPAKIIGESADKDPASAMNQYLS